jgi:hypothetical protein
MARPVDPAQLAAVSEVGAETSNDPALLGALRKLVVNAVQIEQNNPPANQESVDLMRIGAAEIDASPDGIDLSGPMIEGLQLAGLISRPALADPATTAFQSGADMLRETYGAIPAALWIATPGNSRVDQLEAGRRYVRANLRAAALGLAMHPMSQSLQEYAAVAGPFAEIHRLLGVQNGARVQMLARIGYGPAIGPAPRWPLERHIRS